MSFTKVLPFKTDSARNPGLEGLSKNAAVISVGRSAEILRLRQQALLCHGWTVRSVTPEQAETEARSPEQRLWIFCNTVEIVQLVYLACSVRRYSPGSRLILIERSTQPGFELSLFHRALKMTEGDDVLVTAVSELSSAA